MKNIYRRIISMDNLAEKLRERRQFAEPTKTCWGCKHSLKSPGSCSTYREPGEPPMAECDYYDENMNEHKMLYFMELLDKNILTWEEEDASTCPYFEPEIVGFCDKCGEPTDLTVLEAPTSNIFDRQYYCSEECKKESDKEFKKLEDELLKL